MSKKNKILLLHLIKSGGNVKQLLREGLTYKNISELIETLVNEELITYDDEKIRLTEVGNKFLESERIIIIKQNKNLWIDKEKESRIPKLGKDFVFLPNQNEIHF
jgi:predicted transcriptional regulator